MIINTRRRQACIYLIYLNRLFCLHSFNNIFYLKVNFSNVSHLIHRLKKKKKVNRFKRKQEYEVC